MDNDDIQTHLFILLLTEVFHSFSVCVVQQTSQVMAIVRSTLSRSDSLSVDWACLFLSCLPTHNTPDSPEARHSIFIPTSVGLGQALHMNLIPETPLRMRMPSDDDSLAGTEAECCCHRRPQCPFPTTWWMKREGTPLS